MNKETLINEIAARTNESKASTNRFITALQDVVIETVAKGDQVKLTGFVAFTPATRPARTMKNPRTGEDIQVPETKVVRLRALQRFRDAVNGS